MKRILILLLAFIMILTMTACKGGEAGNGNGESFDISVCFASEPTTIDPALNTAVDGAIMLNHVFEGLMKWVDDGNGNAVLAPGIAKEYDLSDDKLVYTFYLREGVLWSDGEPVTAYDFEYAWKRLVDPDTAADYSYIADCMINGPEIIYDQTMGPDDLGAVALDEATFQVTLHTPIPYFEEVAAFPALFPVRKDIIEEFKDQWTFDPATYIGNGPYMMSKWVHNSHILMVKNPNYYDAENLGPDSIKFALMDDNNAKLTAFNSGELDFNEGYPAGEAAALMESGRLKINDSIGTYYACFNTLKSPFDKASVREAFLLTIDRNFIVNQITKTGEIPAAAFVPPSIYDAGGPGTCFREEGGDYFDPSKEQYRANCDKAKELMARAGFPGGENFPIVEYLYNIGDAHRLIGEALQNMWQEELGVTVVLKKQDWASLFDAKAKGEFSIVRNGWFADYNDPITFLDMWVTGSGNNDAKYENRDYDALIRDAKSSADYVKRMELLHKAEDILMEDCVVAPVYYYTNAYMANEEIKGIYYAPLGFYFFDYCHK